MSYTEFRATKKYYLHILFAILMSIILYLGVSHKTQQTNTKKLTNPATESSVNSPAK